MSMTRVAKCTCQNAYQDAQYGAGKRVFNQLGGKKSSKSFRCTICLKEQDIG